MKGFLIMKELDLRVQKTYKALIQALEDLLEEEKFEQISVTELCEQAMVRRPTFYKHFLDKYDFLTFFIKNKINSILDQAFQEMDNDEDNFFLFVFKQLIKELDNVLDLIFSLQMNANIMVELESVQEYGQKILKDYTDINKENYDQVFSDYKRQIMMGTTIQSVYWYKNNQDRISYKEMIDFYQDILKNLQKSNL